MARRSARLQKRLPSPSNDSSSSSSWGTARSSQTPQPERLPSVVEGDEPTTMKDVQKHAQKPASLLCTPKSHTPIKPAGEEMHPALHHASTAKVLDEARWLGFQALGAHTAPPKPSDALGAGQATPSKASKTPVPTSTSKISSIIPSPEFRFRFKSPTSVLSPKSIDILKSGREKDVIAGGRTLFGADEFSTPADVSSNRKIAAPRGKSGRFSDAHMAEFKRMDSIANHPSAFRADPNRFKLVNKPLKRSQSKAELDKQAVEPAAKVPNKLKRTQSKMDLSETNTNQPVMKLVATPLKRMQSTLDGTQPASSLPRAQSTVRLVPPTRDGDSPTKRVKRTETDDAATTRPLGGPDTAKAATPARTLHSQSGLPRFKSRLMTPTKASLARSQSAKAIKSTTTMIPSLLRTPSAKALFSPTNIGETMKEGMREGIRKTSHSLQRVRSILRTPNQKFSDDPSKIAAGTHMSPPPGLDMGKALPGIPATAPIRKHVNFTTSTLEKAAQDELGKSPSPMKLRAGSEVPSGAVIYPTLRAGVEYPALPEGEESPVGSPSRRLTFGGATKDTPGKFSFQSGKPISFGPDSAGTIRMVRKSDASSLIDGKKRKLETFEESSDKENNAPAEDEGRSPKKVKTAVVSAPKTPSSTSKLPRRTPNRTGPISKSRLAFLATPRRFKG